MADSSCADLVLLSSEELERFFADHALTYSKVVCHDLANVPLFRYNWYPKKARTWVSGSKRHGNKILSGEDELCCWVLTLFLTSMYALFQLKLRGLCFAFLPRHSER